jgi:hypothetical protein
MYTNDPPYSLSQPKPTAIVFAGCKVNFGAAEAVYSARTFRIPKPVEAVWYYVVIQDDQQIGDDGTRVLRATCQAAHTLAGLPGRTYVGAILALPGGHSTRVLPGGWPAPPSFRVGP